MEPLSETDSKEIKVHEKNEDTAVKKLAVDAAFRTFDLHKSTSCKNNMEITATTISQTYPEPFCMIDTPIIYCSADEYPFKIKDIEQDPDACFTLNCGYDVKPVACYLEFIDYKELPGTVTVSLTKKKGSSYISSLSEDNKKSSTHGISICNKQTQVDTRYDYSQTISSEETLTWSETFSPGSYYVYQNVMIYSFEFGFYPKWMDGKGVYKNFETSNNMKFYTRDNRYFAFITVYRDDCFTKKYQHDFYSTVSYDDAITYLMGDGFSRWANYTP